MSLIERYWLEQRLVEGREITVLVVRAVSSVDPGQVVEVIEEANALPGEHRIELHFPARGDPLAGTPGAPTFSAG